jgi:hypothetical protein
MLQNLRGLVTVHPVPPALAAKKACHLAQLPFVRYKGTASDQFKPAWGKTYLHQSGMRERVKWE